MRLLTAFTADGRSVVQNQEFPAERSCLDHLPPFCVRSAANIGGIDCVFPNCQPRTGCTPRVHDLGTAARLAINPLEEIQDQGGWSCCHPNSDQEVIKRLARNAAANQIERGTGPTPAQ